MKNILEFMHRVEKLKCITRHADTSTGRRESVAEHSHRLSLLAYLMSHYIKDADMDRVIRICLVHDIGEAIHGDVPCFEKKDSDTAREMADMRQLTDCLPIELQDEIARMIEEFETGSTREGRVARALDKLEAVVQHNESDIASWLELEYTLNREYGQREADIEPHIRELRDLALAETDKKIANEKR